MNYAFILGSNSYIVPGNTISFTENQQPQNFLRILSIHKDTSPDQPWSVLKIDADFKDNEGHVIKLVSNKAQEAPAFDILEQPDRVHITKPGGETVLDVHQMTWKTAMQLEHNIVAELEAHQPVVPIRIRGNVTLGGLHIEMDNEKLFIDANSYANSTLSGKTDLRFSHEGVLI